LPELVQLAAGDQDGVFVLGSAAGQGDAYRLPVVGADRPDEVARSTRARDTVTTFIIMMI
jgi:hypothetical protein